MIAKTQLRLDDDTYAKIKAIADTKERSINKQIVYILEQYIKDYEKINGELKIEK